MSVLKRLGAVAVSLAMLLSICSNGIVAFASDEEFALAVTNIQKYDESTHTVLDDTITSAEVGDIIAVSYGVSNQAGSNAMLVTLKFTALYSPDTLEYYEKDETDEDWDGKFYENGYTALTAMTAVANCETNGKTVVSLGHPTGVAAKKNQATGFVQVLYKVVDSSDEKAEFSFDASEGTSQVMTRANNTDTSRTVDTTAKASILMAHAHTLTKVEAKEATCDEDGNIEYWTCSAPDCGKTFSDAEGKTEIARADTVIKAKGHTLTATAAKAATCDEDGNIAYWTCSVCGKLFSDAEGKTEIAQSATVEKAKGHTLSKVEAKAATETEAGNIEYWTCSVCGKFFSDAEGKTEIAQDDTIIPPTGHVTHTVSVTNGDGSGSYKPGDTVHIIAPEFKDGNSFQNWTWTGPDGFVIPNATSRDTTFSMPNGNVEVTANYGGCYIATAVYGSYDCPEVWTLRRFRDKVLGKTWYGRLFIHLYYAVSPTMVRLFGKTAFFQNFWRERLDNMISALQTEGFESTPYNDMPW